MVETLLRSNRRIAGLLLGLSAVPIAAGGVMIVWKPSSPPLLATGITLVVVGLMWLLTTGWMARQPRLGYQDGSLLVYLRAGRPLRVPLEVVEVFFLGQGPVGGEDPANGSASKGMVAANVVVRLAEAATEWHRRDVNVTLGVWRDGYITVRGLWCEPLDRDVMQRLNRQLVDLKRARRRQVEELAS